MPCRVIACALQSISTCFAEFSAFSSCLLPASMALWLSQLLCCAKRGCYVGFLKQAANAGQGFAKHYKQLASDRYYVKLDDDVMYIQPGAVEAMLHEKLRNRFWIVSANVINHSGKPSPTCVSASYLQNQDQDAYKTRLLIVLSITYLCTLLKDAADMIFDSRCQRRVICRS